MTFYFWTNFVWHTTEWKSKIISVNHSDVHKKNEIKSTKRRDNTITVNNSSFWYLLETQLHENEMLI